MVKEIGMQRFFALLDGKPGAYGVAFPDCSGCTAMGADENEAYANAVEALGEWIHDARADGAAPAPRSVAALRRDPEVKAALADGAVFLAVPLILETGRPVKANISLDRGLLEAIDEAAKRAGLTRSAFLASAARAKIEAAG
jgi:predicted RNase H-like HicB family nuclease